MKKKLMKVIAFMCLLGVITPLQSVGAAGIENSNSGFQKINLDEKFVPKTDKELQKIYDSGESYTVELTYDQAVKRTAEIQNKSVSEVKAENIQNAFNTTYNISNLNMEPQAAASSVVCSWVESSNPVTVKSTTQTMIAIVKACRSGSAAYLNTSTKPLLQEFKATKKSYSGTVEVDLNTTGYYWVANGHFYDSTTTTHEGTTGANAVWTATYSVSSSYNHYADYYSGLKWRQVSY